MHLVDELQKMARELDEDPAVYVFAWIEPKQGASDAEIAAAEKQLGVALPDTLRQFYRAMNGFGVVWVHEQDFDDARAEMRLGDQPFESSRTLNRKQSEFPWTNGADESRFDASAEVSRIDHRATGYVRIPTLANLVANSLFSGFVDMVEEVDPPVETCFDGETQRLVDVYRRFVVLDHFSASEQCFLYLGPGPRHLRVHRMTNGFELSDYDLHIGVDDYFTAVIAARGRTDARRRLFERVD